MLQTYLFPIILITSVFLGGLFGCLLGDQVVYLKPLGDMFLNFIFVMIVPLVFFSVSSSIARAKALGKLSQIAGYMAFVFIVSSVLVAALAIIVVLMFPPALGAYIQLPHSLQAPNSHLLQQLSGIFSVSEFSKLLSHQNMTALIIFSILVGLAASSSSEGFKNFLNSGEEVFMRVFSYIMYYAPVGFFAYFAVLVSELGPSLISNYVRVSVIYYSLAIIYFVVGYSLSVYGAGGKQWVIQFWKQSFLPVTTSLATCSGIASIPSNLMATKKMGVPVEIAEPVVSLGAILHKEGSVIGGVIKIAFLFGVFGLDFSGTSTLLMALGVSLLVGTVMGAIPSGGMLGELLILSVYGFPPESLVVIAAISVIIDPIATLLNVVGNTVSAIWVKRLMRV